MRTGGGDTDTYGATAAAAAAAVVVMVATNHSRCTFVKYYDQANEHAKVQIKLRKLLAK